MHLVGCLHFAAEERHLAPIVVMSYEYTVHIPEGKTRKFRAMVKDLGGGISRGRRLSAYEQSLADVKNGKVYGPFNNVDALFKELTGNAL